MHSYLIERVIISARKIGLHRIVLLNLQYTLENRIILHLSAYVIESYVVIIELHIISCVTLVSFCM